MKFEMFSDPSHSWLKVPIQFLDTLKIKRKISHFSYVKENFVYLEEDCDFPLFVQAMQDEGRSFEIVEHHSNRMSRIRSYNRYQSMFKE